MKYLLSCLVAISAAASPVSADNRSDQMNPNNDAYWDSRGYDGRPDDWESYSSSPTQSSDNRSNQLNPNNDAYWQSRGYDERPNDWASPVDDHTLDSYYDDDTYVGMQVEQSSHSINLPDNNSAKDTTRDYSEENALFYERMAAFAKGGLFDLQDSLWGEPASTFHKDFEKLSLYRCDRSILTARECDVIQHYTKFSLLADTNFDGVEELWSIGVAEYKKLDYYRDWPYADFIIAVDPGTRETLFFLALDRQTLPYVGGLQINEHNGIRMWHCNNCDHFQAIDYNEQTGQWELNRPELYAHRK